MIKPKIMRATNPQTGQVIEEIRWPNIFVYGLTESELNILNKSLPGKEVEITDVTGDASGIVEKVDFAIVINTDNISEDELNFFEEFYKDFDGCTETIIFTGANSTAKEKFRDVKSVYYKDDFTMERNMKYDLLQAYQKTAKSDGYSEKLAMLLKILFAIVQRYIETLRCAGEFIEYDRGKNGWYLMVDGKSVLMDEI